MNNTKRMGLARRKGLVTRMVVLAMALTLLAAALTGCMGGGRVTPTLTTKSVELVENGDHSLSTDNLTSLAEAIKASKNGLTVREQLVAALNGYDMTAEGFNDDQLPAKQPDKAGEFGRNALKKAELDTAVNFDALTRDDVQSLVNCFKTEVNTEAETGLVYTLLHWVGIAFGWMINTLGFGSFLLGTFFFAILVEILMLPLGIRQQNNSRKQAKLRPKEMAIRKKYAGRTDQATQQKVAQEVQEMYQKEGYSPMAGCLPLLLSMPVILALYYIVIDPLKYMMGAPTELSTALTSFATAAKAAGGLGIDLASKNGTIEILSLIGDHSIEGLANFGFFTNGAECVTALTPMMESVPSFTALGINFGLTPAFDFTSVNAWLLLVPVLTFVLYFLSAKLNRKLMMQPAVQQDAATGCSNTMMDVMMPAMSAWFTFMVPAAVGIYWGYKSILSMLKQVILSKVMPLPVFTEADYKAAEKELAGKEKSKPAKKSGTRNPNVRSLHHIDDDDGDYNTLPPVKEPETEASPAEESAPAKDEGPVAAGGAYGDGVTMKDDRDTDEKKGFKLFGKKDKSDED